VTRLASWVSRLEHLQEADERVRKPDRPWWWELPDDEWHLGAVGFSHEDALAELDALEAEEGERD
jgi:hypothetical protein